MSEHEVRMIVLSTDDLDESIRFYSETLGMPVKFRDGAHFAALDGGAVTLALPQRRKIDPEHVQPVEKVLAQVALVQSVLELFVGGGEHTHVHRDFRCPADRTYGALLEHA